MLITLLLLASALFVALATYVAFAQLSIFSSLVDHDEDRRAAEDYARTAIVTRFLEKPRIGYLQLAAIRTLFRWLAVGCLVAAGFQIGGPAPVLAAVGVGFLLFVLEEELPLRLVLRNPAAYALRLFPPMGILVRVLKTMTPLFDVAYRVCKFMIRNRAGAEPPMSVEELTMMAAAGGADLGLEERRILRGIFRSSGILVADIMTPRERTASLPANATIGEALDRFRDNRHSRLPVYEESLDRVVGIAHAKDFLRAAFEPGEHGGPVKRYLRDPYFVRQDRKIHELFEELRESKVHLAVVVDRMGRTVGIVGLEDILEEIVGEIHDELESEKAEAFPEPAPGAVR